MKKTLTTLLILAGIAMGGAPEWTVSQTDENHVTYTTTQIGSFTFDDLGDAVIEDGESFTFTMTFTCTTNPFVQANGLSFLAARGDDTSDLYDISGKGNNQFRLYIRPNDNCLMLDINNYSYGYGEASMDSTSYTSTLPETVSTDTPVKLAFQLTYVSAKDAADGDNYFTFSSLEGSQIQIDPITDKNVVRNFNFSDLTNYTGTYVNAPAELETTISITKSGMLPEPTTATLSLLALAGLAARRRRK